MEHFSYKGGYDVMHIKIYKGRASSGYTYEWFQVINNIMLFKTVIPVKN